MKETRLKAPAILLIFIIIVVLYHIFGYTGHFGYDDLHYAQLANDLVHGKIDFEDHYAYRLPVILFTSLFYLIFGISDLTSSLPAILITIAILVIVFYILRDKGPITIITGLSLVTLSHWLLFYSDKLMPDIYVALSVVSALAIIDHYKYRSDKRRTFLHASLLAFSLLFGFLAKGTIVLTVPLLLYLAITDLVRRRDLKFWLYSIVTGIALLGIYLLILWVLTGNMMKRFDAISNNSYLNLCSYDQQSLGILMKRIFAGFFELSIYQSLATGFIFIIAFLFQRKAGSYFRLNDSFSFFLVSALILFLSSSFMTISIHAYAPMCLDPRHYLFLVPVASIPASEIIASFVQSKKAAIQIVCVLFMVTVISFFLPGGTCWKLYLPLLILFTVYLFTGTGKRYQNLFMILFTAILLLIPLYMTRYATGVKYRKQREILKEQVLKKNPGCIIITDEVQKRLLAYYSHFKAEQTRRFLSFDDFRVETAPPGRKLMLLNRYTIYLSGMAENDLPWYARNISPQNRIVFTSRKPDLTLYEMIEFNRFDKAKNKIFTSFNSFENSVPYWNQDDQDLSDEIRYAGSRSNRVARFSSTFDYPLDSIHFRDLQSLVIQCDLVCYAPDKSDTKLIVSLEDATGTYFWRALQINRYMKAYSHWWPVSFDVRIDPEGIRKESRLKVYLWKSDGPYVYVDNFRISVYGVKP
jgi:hypothetical protein